MTPIPKIRERNARYESLYDQVWDRVLGPTGPKLGTCRLGREGRKGRVAKCSICKLPNNLEIDSVIANLIAKGTIKSTADCPYNVFATALLRLTTDGPDADQANEEAQRVTITEIEIALRHIDRAVSAQELQREHIKIDRSPMANIVRAEEDIRSAVRLMKESYEDEWGKTFSSKPVSARGRPRKLAQLGLVMTCIEAWNQLIGSKPAKNNTKFQALLGAAFVTVFGEKEQEPNWEWLIAQAKT